MLRRRDDAVCYDIHAAIVATCRLRDAIIRDHLLRRFSLLIFHCFDDFRELIFSRFIAA